MSADGPAVREPKQARSRDSWERVLDTGLQLLEEGGAAALTISEVCRRSGVSPPSLYARVDGLAGLFGAVWERGMQQVHATEDRRFAGLPGANADAAQRAADAACAVADVFEEHAAFLRPVIARAGDHPALLRNGAAESRRLLERVVVALALPEPTASDIARTVYAACVLRTMYGADFFTDEPESADDFRSGLGRTAAALTGAALTGRKD